MTDTQEQPERTRINVGLGRVLTFVYGLFALSAGARAGVQIATKFHVAPLAYLLSAFSAVVYLVATVCLARSTPRSRRIAIVCCTVELIGVVVIGAVSVIRPSLFPDPTVWSDFGWGPAADGHLGYALVPLILPIIGLWWLRRLSRIEDSAVENSSQISA